MIHRDDFLCANPVLYGTQGTLSHTDVTADLTGGARSATHCAQQFGVESGHRHVGDAYGLEREIWRGEYL